MNKHLKRIFAKLSILVILMLFGCSFIDYDMPDSNCAAKITANISYTDLKNLTERGTTKIHEDLIIEGVVVSSDVAGNFFNTLILQENLAELAQGIQIHFELRDSHLFYPPGTRITIKLKGLYLSVNNGDSRIGSAASSFGSLVVSRIPKLAIDQYLVPACALQNQISPRELFLDSISDSDIHTLVLLRDMEFSEGELGQPYAIPKEETDRTLINCAGQTIKLINSGYSDFQSEIIPDGNGSVTGILVRHRQDYGIIIRDTRDISFNNDRCSVRFPLVTSDSIFITEIADPDNDTGGRFVELYNSSQEEVPLKGWELRRYTNGSTEISHSIDLSGYVVKSSETIVISPDVSSFQSIYGFRPGIEAGFNSAANSNGDDNLELVDPFGIVIDRFGIPGEDGSGTNHEFEDGGAFRRTEVQSASPEYMFEEWIIYNDTGAEGTIKQALIAPVDFTPGER